MGMYGSTNSDGLLMSIGAILEHEGACPGTVQPGNEDEEEYNDDPCECVADNGLPKIDVNGDNVIIYTDGDGNEYSYPAAYGTACVGWDETLPPYCGDENGRPLDGQPGWCTAAWCYVDQNTCRRSDMESSAFFGE